MESISLLSEVLQLSFFRKALAVLVCAGISFPLAGVFVVSLDLIPLRFLLMHVALLGAAVGLFIGQDPLVSGLVLCLVTSIFLGPLSDRVKLTIGTSSGVLMTITIALAFLLFHKAGVMAMDAFAILSGNVLALSSMDVWITACLSFSIIVFIIVFLRPVTAVLFDRETARLTGIPDSGIYYLLIFLVGAVVGVAMKLVGVLLLDAILILPAAAAFLVGRNLRQIFFFSSLFGLVSAVLGMWVSLAWDIPVSSSITFVGGIIMLISYGVKKAVR